MSDALKFRDEQVFSFISAKLKRDGRSPSFAEMVAATGYRSKHGVSDAIDRLVWAGRLRRIAGPGCARCLELVQTKDDHRPNCACSRCSEARYLAQLKLVQAIQVPLPVALHGKRLDGIAPVSPLTKIYWLSGFPRSLRPGVRGAA